VISFLRFYQVLLGHKQSPEDKPGESDKKFFDIDLPDI
jgi:hypothetical protein